jgi:hypothetical protein
MNEAVELMHACGAPAGEANVGDIPELVRRGYRTEESDLFTRFLPESNSDRRCTTCPLKGLVAPALEEAIATGEAPENCYFTKIPKSVSEAQTLVD